MSESEDIFLAERKRRTRLAVGIAVLVLVPVGFFVVSDVRLILAKNEARLNEAQRAELARLLDARQRQAQARVEQWNVAAQREVVAALALGEAPCPVSLATPTPLSAAAYVKFGTRDSVFGDWALCFLRPEAKADACAQTWAATEDEAKLRGRLEAYEVFTWDLEAAKAAAPVSEPARVLVLVETETPFKIREALVGKLSYVPAQLGGRAFLWIPAEGRFVCGAAVTAQNSKSVETEWDDLGKPSQQRTEEEARAALRRDLEVRVRLALSGAWRTLISSN